jgi:hypothetical protein
MALIRCPDCNNEISDAAPSCPTCGRPKSLASASVGSASEAILLQDGSVTVTSQRVTVGGETLDVRKLGGVRLGDSTADPEALKYVLYIKGCFSLCVLSVGSLYLFSRILPSEIESVLYWLIGGSVLGAIASGIKAMRLGRVPVVFVTIGGSERGILKCDKALGNRVVCAIQTAMLASRA